MKKIQKTKKKKKKQFRELVKVENVESGSGREIEDASCRIFYILNLR